MSVIERRGPLIVNAPEAPHRTLCPFAAFEASTTSTHALIILNTDLNKISIRSLWKTATVRVCADGGANRLFDFFETEEERANHLPQYITGDLDSIRDDVCRYYTSKGSVLIKQFCQYSTDFKKSLQVALLHCSGEAGRISLKGNVEQNKGLEYLLRLIQPSPTLSVYVAGGLGGRLDQSFHLINQLYSLTLEYPGVEMYFHTGYDVIFLLHKGTNFVKYSTVRTFNRSEPIPRCGLLPFGRKVILNTRGLQFDVQDWTSEVGGAVSTSNGVVGKDGFVVDTSDDIVMNIEVDFGNMNN